MTTNMYYGEIVAKITSHLFKSPAHIETLERTISTREDDGETIFTICADAARVFDTLENLSGEHFIDWNCALDYYATQILGHMLEGGTLHLADMISIASVSIQHARA